MSERVRHPLLLAALRAVLYVVALGAAVAVLGVTFGFFGVVFGLGTLSLVLLGEANALLLFAALGAGLLLTGTALAVLTIGARRVDRFLLHAARVPDPLDRLATRYVADEIDERELERGIERVLSESGGDRSHSGRGGVDDARRLGGRSRTESEPASGASRRREAETR